MSTPQDALYRAYHNAFEAQKVSNHIANALQIIDIDDDMQQKSLVLEALQYKIDNLDKKMDLIIYMLKEKSQ